MQARVTGVIPAGCKPSAKPGDRRHPNPESPHPQPPEGALLIDKTNTLIMSKTKILCHIVFATKMREKTINPDHKRDLYGYIYTILEAKHCFLHKMNGTTDHIHFLIDLHPSVSLADLMKDIKTSSSHWLKRNPHFMKFKGWAQGYYAASLGVRELVACKKYIQNQEDHHKTHELIIELETLIRAIEMEWYPDDWI